MGDQRHVSVLLVGPYDPSCGEYTFVSPPLGVWRLAGYLRRQGIYAEVFDPNLGGDLAAEEFRRILRRRAWTVVGFSTTGMTLPHDLSLAHLAKRHLPTALLIAGGMEATFNPEKVASLGPFDLLVLGEGERPVVELLGRVSVGRDIEGIPGTIRPQPDGTLTRINHAALTREELRDAIFSVPYREMPYRAYWVKLEAAYAVGKLPSKAERESRLAEIRSVRLMTLNYCPMNCTFCSSTNFLTTAQGSTARMARLDADECLTLIKRIVRDCHGVRTIIFQDDIFVFPNDTRIIPLCDMIVAAKQTGELPDSLQFISTNRIDSMTTERLQAMRRAGFRVLGFGVENVALPVLREFNKARIHPRISPVLQTALDLGIVPFLDMILTSPLSTLSDLAENVRQAFRWIVAGCEVGMYPYVIPFSGAAMSSDSQLTPHTVFTTQRVPGTTISWQQPTKILPRDAAVRDAIVEIEERCAGLLAGLKGSADHLPSRVRSLFWILASLPTMERLGHPVAEVDEVWRQLSNRLPTLDAREQRSWSSCGESAGAA